MDETTDLLILPVGIYVNYYLQSLEYSFSSREKWPESELNELAASGLNSRA